MVFPCGATEASFLVMVRIAKKVNRVVQSEPGASYEHESVKKIAYQLKLSN